MEKIGKLNLKKIIWNSVSLNKNFNDGYANVEEKIYNYIFSKKIEIEKKQYIPPELKKIFDLNINLGYESEHEYPIYTDIVINHCLPTNYSIANDYSIGFTYWETNKLPNRWIPRMNRMDEVWTTSSWAREIFLNSGVAKPVYDFKVGINSELFYPELRKIKKNEFTFLSIGGPSTRKNSQMAVDAFLKLFRNDHNYKLIYKCVGEPDARAKSAGGEISSIYDIPNIKVICDDLPLEDLAKLYDSVDCVIYPTSGEGWGILPFQAIAKGIPTICTNFSACTEYASMSLPLDYELGNEKMTGIYENCGEWAIPKFDDLCDKMLYVVNNYDEVANFTYLNAKENQNLWSWETAADGYYKRLCHLIN